MLSFRQILNIKIFVSVFWNLWTDLSVVQGEKPSIAAIVGSMDPKAGIYECQIRVQHASQNEEIIQDMKDVTKKLLLKFLSYSKGKKPQMIIMFR